MKNHPHFLQIKRTVESTLPNCSTDSCTKHASVRDGETFYCAACAISSEGFRKKIIKYPQGGKDEAR